MQRYWKKKNYLTWAKLKLEWITINVSGFMAFYSLLMSILGGKVSFISMVLNPDCIFNLLWNFKKKKKKTGVLVSFLEVLI